MKTVGILKTLGSVVAMVVACNVYAQASGPATDSTSTAASVKAGKRANNQLGRKVRGALTVAKDASREAIEQLAAAHEMVAKFSEGKAPKKIVVVPGRLVNVVV